MTIIPSTLSGEVCVPASKSLVHRGLLCAALAGDLSLCTLPPEDEMSDDIRATLGCAGKLLARLHAGARSETSFDCRESGTTLRLLLPILAALGVHAGVSASGRLPQRPLAEYIELFAAHGATLSAFNSQPSAFTELSGRLTPGVYRIRGDVSSQYISGLLMALPLLDGDSEIILTTTLESKPYVDMTLGVLAHFGIFPETTSSGWKTKGLMFPRVVSPLPTEPDFSHAAFWLLAAHIGNPVAVSGLPRETKQGDRVFASLLGSPEVDVSDCPDLLPALAGAAAFASYDTSFTGAARLRLKESDRLETTQAMLAAFGVESEITADTMTVRGLDGKSASGTGATLRSCTVDGANDHRIVMTAAMLATRASGPVMILGAEAVNKSYPRFFRDFAKAGGRVTNV